MEEGDRIAQLVLEKIYTPQVVEVEVCQIVSIHEGPADIWHLQNLDDTVRGTSGFGSTGGHLLL